MIPEIRFINGSTLPVRNIYCVGRNYTDHAMELGNKVPDSPMFFQKSTATIASGSCIEIPKGTEIHHELELVVCIGRDVLNLDDLHEETCISGFTIGLDLTDRTSQSELKAKGKPWFWAKSFRNSTILGQFQPYDSNGINEEFTLLKNGQLTQSGSINDTVFSIPDLLMALISRVPLLQGDILFTGTPSGVGPLLSGDKLDLKMGGNDILSMLIK